MAFTLIAKDTFGVWQASKHNDVKVFYCERWWHDNGSKMWETIYRRRSPNENVTQWSCSVQAKCSEWNLSNMRPPFIDNNLSKIYCDASLSFIILHTIQDVFMVTRRAMAHNEQCILTEFCCVDAVKHLHANDNTITHSHNITFSLCLCRSHMCFCPHSKAVPSNIVFCPSKLSSALNLIYTHSIMCYKMRCHCSNGIYFMKMANNHWKLNIQLQ